MKAKKEKISIALRVITALLLFLLVGCALLSRPIENASLIRVKLALPFKGSITTKSNDHIPTVLRVRAPATLVIEDILVSAGTTLKAGDAIASVYPKALDDAIVALTNKGAPASAPLHALTVIRENGYRITAEADGTLLTLGIETDGTAEAEQILYKYLPKGESFTKEVTQFYDTIVPMAALTPLTDGEYLIYFAIPNTGKGEAGRYTVAAKQVKVLATDGTYAALAIGIYDERRVIVSATGPLAHRQIVLAE